MLTSGGDAPGMNTAIRAVTKLAAGQGVRVLGVENGYEGLMAGRFRELTCEVGGEMALPPEIDDLSSSGGTFLGSARSKRFVTPEGRTEAARRLDGVDGLVVIGGNGSLAGAHALAQEHGVRVMGIPASIDNDIGCTGMAIGVDTALNTIIEACDRITDTARAHRRAFVVEVMGRDCGYLAMASAVAAGADAVLFREQERSEEEIVEVVEQAILRAFAPPRNKRRALVIKAEGVPMPCTKLVRILNERVSEALEGVEVRATVLGHVVRGGNPSYEDRRISGRLAFGAVDGLLSGAGDEMVAWQPVTEGGTATRDASVRRFPLAQVLEETAALLDGSSPITRRRMALIEKVEGILGL